MTSYRRRSRPQHHRIAGWIILVSIWLGALAACEWLAHRLGGFVLVDGRPASLERHQEGGDVTIETLGGVAVWKRPHPDRPTPKPSKDGFRIAVLGDSILLPALLDDRDGAVRLLEAKLNADVDAGPYEVVNFSEGGWNTLQQEQVLLHEVWPLAPDLILVGLSPKDHQQFAYRDGELFEVSFLRDLERRRAGWAPRILLEHSYLYNWLWLRWMAFADVRAPLNVEFSAIVQPLQRMAASSRARNVPLAIVCMPMLLGNRFDPSRDHCSYQGVSDWAERDGVPLLNPVPAYSAYPTRDLRLDDIHLSRLGHRVLATTLFTWLVDRRLVPYHDSIPASTVQ